MRFLHRLYTDWKDDNAMMLAAAVAFYATFSVGPLLLMIVSLGSIVFDEEATRREIVETTARFVNPRAAQAVGRIIVSATTGDRNTVTVFSGLLLLFGASGVFRQLRLALNIVLDVPDPKEGWIAFFRSRAIAVVMVIATMCLLVVVMSVTATLGMIRQFFPLIPAADIAVWRTVDFIVTALLITGVISAILKWVPDVDLRWRHVWKGAAIASLLFAVGRLLIGLYLGRAMATSIYGAAASLFITLVVIFFAVLLVLLAAEITQLLGARDAEFNARINHANERRMTEKDDRPDRGETIPQAKRRGRQGPEPEAQPGEFADEMLSNRFTPPPDPPVDRKK